MTFWQSDGVRNCHDDLMASKMFHFGHQLVAVSHLGSHQVAEAIWSPFDSGTSLICKSENDEMSFVKRN